MRTFTMIRDYEPVAEGVVFSDNVTVIHWVTTELPRSTVVWNSLQDALIIHDHDGRTTIEWA